MELLECLSLWGVRGVGGEESKVEVGRGYLMEFCPLLSFWSLFPFADYD